MQKKAFFFIDDVIWVFRDLTRQNPESLFDHPFLAHLKEAHAQYGLKVQLNLFYQTDRYYGNDEFNLSEMTDRYKQEWTDNADWLKFGFHSRQEFPDYPYINANYDTVYEDFKLIENAVLRFASKENMARATTPHWRPISKEACLALRDCGVRLLSATYGKKIEYDGDASSLPTGMPKDCFVTARRKRRFSFGKRRTRRSPVRCAGTITSPKKSGQRPVTA